MSLISKSAYLKVCEKCLMHGTVVLADGSESVPFATKEKGRDLVRTFLTWGQMDEDEAWVVLSQIEGSNFYESSDLLDSIMERVPLGGRLFETADADEIQERLEHYLRN